uniref:Potassium channel domain-containing protein n=1 Tax=Ditylenchus dipsaci TaxID=166011 RepID=A0A915CKW0_9BILA
MWLPFLSPQNLVSLAARLVHPPPIPRNHQLVYELHVETAQQPTDPVANDLVWTLAIISSCTYVLGTPPLDFLFVLFHLNSFGCQFNQERNACTARIHSNNSPTVFFKYYPASEAIHPPLQFALPSVYLCIPGGVVFNELEADAVVQQNKRDFRDKLDCVTKVFEGNTNKSSRANSSSGTAAAAASGASVDDIVRCFQTEVDVRSQWSFVTATLYGFGIVTTLGYNRIAPVTLAGRLFCVVYGLCGIPMTMIIIANIGQYLNQFAGATRKNFEVYRERKRLRRASIKGEDVPESSIEVVSIWLLITFLAYVCFGAILLPLLNGELDFLNGIYFNFLCLTAIDFGQLVPARVAFLPITFLYVCIGLAITTIAIDIGSEYLKKLHNFGKKMKNVASTKIWFGGKTWVAFYFLDLNVVGGSHFSNLKMVRGR